MFEKVEGFILRTQDYGETHKIVTIMTPSLGKIGAVARGAKKAKSRMAAITQPFIHGSYLIQPGNNLATLQQGEVITSFRKIRQDIVKTAYASYIAELTDKLLDPKKYNPFIYEQLLHTISFIDEGKDAEVLTMIYEWKMYQESGISPVIDRCVFCGNQHSLKGFSVREGGTICTYCTAKDEHLIYLSETLLKLFHLFLWIKINRIGNISIKDENKNILRTLMDQYYDQYGGFYLKSKRFLNQMNKWSDFN
nr:DNA repair protein RecO [Gracilibacillus sp. YIM 98692]